MNKNLDQNIPDYVKALQGRLKKFGDRTVFFNLPVSYHKFIKSGSKNGFCDMPTESNVTEEVCKRCKSHLVGVYSSDVTFDEIVEDLEYFLENGDV